MTARRALLAGTAVALVCLLAILSLNRRYASFHGEAFVDIPKGTGAGGAAGVLREAGVVKYRWQFLLARALKPRAKLQAGEYHFTRPASAWEVFDRMARGDVFYYELVVPEGSDMFDIAAGLNRLPIGAAAGFLDAARNPILIRDLAPAAQTLEGYLFPATYRITRHTTPEQFCREMTGRFRRAWKEAGGGRDVQAAVTLASLIEKETARDDERARIASVYRNRHRIGMALQCDPTVIYAAQLEGRYRGVIYRSDLESKNPYNTYVHAGLPPGPIANPGLASLKAALHPAESSYLYFVAIPGGAGAHQFSERLETHQLAVAKYRRADHKAKQTKSPAGISRKGAARNRHPRSMAGPKKTPRAGL